MAFRPGVGLTSVASSTTPLPGLPTSRPYRSHRVPACHRCRSRKVRCTVDIPGQPCLICRLQNAACHQPRETSAGNVNTRNLIERPSKRHRALPPHEVLSSNTDRRRAPGSASAALRSAAPPAKHLISRPREPSSVAPYPLHRTAENEVVPEKTPMIVGPAAAEDVQVIEEFMTSTCHSPELPWNAPYRVISSDRSRPPVLYHSVPTWRKGWKAASMRGSSQRDILEHILGPLAPALVAVYFDRIHPWFPVLDKASFASRNGGGNSAAAIFCEMYASSLIYWASSSDLSPHPRPDITYVWNLAVAATEEDFQAPSLTTICAALLDLNGRPTSSIKGNVLTSARTVALSHTFGLNRDPTSWNLPDAEKDARIRLWWGLLIHDRWSSFAHGVPPSIVKGQYDVPFPMHASLLDGSEERTERGTDCFLAMCGLTEILAELLPRVYHLQIKSSKESFRGMRRVQAALDDWEEALPNWITEPDTERDNVYGGSCSLRLSLLAVRMLVCRIVLRDIKLAEPSDPDKVQYHNSELRKSAHELVTFVCVLERSQLKEFWLPYAAYHIASAAILLIRCAIDVADLSIKTRCKDSLKQLIKRLQNAKETDDWDIGDICLAQCCEPVAAISADLESMPTSSNPAEVAATAGQDISVSNLELHALNFFPFSDGDAVDDLQYPWATQWDALEPPSSMFMR